MNPYIILCDQEPSADRTDTLVWIGNSPSSAFSCSPFVTISRWCGFAKPYDVDFTGHDRFPEDILLAARTGLDTDQEFATLEDTLAFVRLVYERCAQQ